MKYFLSAILSFVFLYSAAQKEDEYQTIFSNINSYGWYGTVSINYTKLDKRDALLLGGRGAWIIDHYLAIGGAGYGFFNEAEHNLLLDPETKYKLSGGYGGILFSPILAPKSPVHLTFPVVIGAGGVSYSKVFVDNWDNDGNENYQLDSEAFFVIEPGIELELNLIKILRLSFGAYYRFTSDIILETDAPFLTTEKIPLTNKDVLTGFSYGISIKIGRF